MGSSWSITQIGAECLNRGVRTCLCPGQRLNAGKLLPQVESSELGVRDAHRPADYRCGHGASDIERGGERASLKTRLRRQLHAQRGQKGYKLVDGHVLSVYMDLHCGRVPACLVGSGDGQRRLADLQVSVCDSSRERLQVLVDRKL